MKLAVVQLRRRNSSAEDAAHLVESVTRAGALGAELVVVPYTPWLAAAAIDAVIAAGDSAPSTPTVLVSMPLPAGVAVAGPERGVELELTPLGRTASMTGDDCLDPLLARELSIARPDAIVLRPGSESELQAEAVLELALGLSESASGLIVIAETDGAADGEPGHGGSAVVVLGEVTAEAQTGDDVLVADIVAPVQPPDVRIPLPDLPTILAQRFALHRGERVAVDYPADLS